MIPPGPRQYYWLIDFGLLVGRQFRRQVDRAGQVGAALDRARIARHRVLEHRRLEDLLLRSLAAGRQRDSPLHRKTGVVVAGRHGEQLEVRVVGLAVVPQKQPSELPSEVASAGIERSNFANAGSAPTSDGPKSETMTSISGFLAISAVSTCWVRAGSQLVTAKGAGVDEDVLVVRARSSGPSARRGPGCCRPGR